MTYETRLESVAEPNKKLLKAFIRHKSLIGLSPLSIKNYVECTIRFVGYCNNKCLDEISREDVEEAVLNMLNTLSKGTVSLTVHSARIVFADLFGKGKAEELFHDIHIRVPVTKVRDEELLTEEEIRRMITAALTERDRALIAVLYASGCRCSEILNLKIKDLTFNQYGASIRVCGKTGERVVDLFVGVIELKNWFNVHPLRDDPDAPLWVSVHNKRLSKEGFDAVLHRTAKRAGIPESKRHNPHSFRHKRATDCAQIMTVADMKEMFGWSQGSDMPSVYVHSSRDRVKEKLMAQAGIKVPESRKPTMMVKQCSHCGCINSSTAVLCVACSMPLDEELARVDKEYQEYLREHAAELLAWKAEKEKEKKNTQNGE